MEMHASIASYLDSVANELKMKSDRQDRDSDVQYMQQSFYIVCLQGDG